MKLNSNYWEERYQNNETGWDTGKITPPLQDYIDQIENKSIQILIPGGGNSYEFEYLISCGCKNAHVLDFAKNPLENIKKRMPLLDDKQLIHSDFFEHSGQYDLIIEQTFFCALEPHLRAKYVEKMKALLKPKGKLVGLLFQFPLTEVGPPFGGSKEDYFTLFENDFYIKRIETAYNSIKPRKENELFFIFEKK